MDVTIVGLRYQRYSARSLQAVGAYRFTRSLTVAVRFGVSGG